MNAAAWLIFSVIATLIGGCSATIVLPKAPVDPTTVYVADYARHSSLVLPRPDGGWTEYAWGEWDWYARGNAHWYQAPRAMFFSDRSTLSQRNFGAKKDAHALQRALGANHLLAIQCSRERVEALRNRLNEHFSRNSLTLMHSDYSEMDHVQDDEHYWAFHNCNHVTARWLRALGCDVKGEPFLSHFKMRAE